MRLFKLLRLLMHLLLGIVLTWVLTVILRQSSTDTLFRTIKRWWLSHVSQILGIQITVVGAPAKSTVQFVSNHISWLDVPLLAGIANPNFLSKAGIKRWPIVGWMAAKSGTLFIHRGNKSSAQSITREMTATLAAKADSGTSNNSILFFPEGTTSNGEGLRRFRPRLFLPAINSEVRVQPILLRYPHAKYKHKTNPAVPFIDEQPVFESLWKILGEKKVSAEVYFLAPITSQGKTTKELATRCETHIRRKLGELIA